MTDETKKCPMCAETIQAEARVCRYCGARFDISRLGYCATDHRITQADQNGSCSICGNPLLDVHLESKLIPAESPVVAAAAPAPPPAVESTEWIIEPVRGEGVNWRFNGVFLDALLINLIFSLMFLILSAPIALLEPEQLSEELVAIYSGTMVGALPLTWLVYLFVCESVWGKTPGKKSSYLQVIRKDGGKIRWWQALIRAICGLFEYNPIGAIVIWVTPLKQRIGDLIAGTLVVNSEKLYRVEFQAGHTAFEFHDHRRVEFARITSAVVYKFGFIRNLTLEGISPQGFPVKLRWVTQFQRNAYDRIRREIEHRYDLFIPEKIILWRLLLLITVLLIFVLGIIVLIVTAIESDTSF